MNVVLLSTDLMVVSRVQATANAGGASFVTVSSAAQGVATCRAIESATLVIDLGIPQLDLNALVTELNAGGTQPPRIIAFGPHVHEQKLAAARQAGCDLVVSRGQFFAQLETMLHA